MYSVGIKVISVKLRAHDLNPKHTLYDLYMGNVLDLTANLESSVGKIPKAWPFLLKHFIPQVLLALFINLAFAKNGQGQTQFAHYEGYLEWPFQVTGIIVVGLVSTMFILGSVKPNLYSPIASVQEMSGKLLATKDSSISVTKGDYPSSPYIEMSSKSHC